MNLLHICDHFYPDRTGGSEIVIYETCRRLAGRGHDVSVVTLRSSAALPSESTVEGINVYRFDIKDMNHAASQIPFGVRGVFKKVAAQRRPEIIHFHHTPSALGVNLGVMPKSVKKRVYTYYGPINQEFEVERRDKNAALSLPDRIKSRLYLLAERYNLSRCADIIALSRYSITQIRGLHGKAAERKAIYIPGGIDAQKFSYGAVRDSIELRKKLGLPVDAVVILTVRRLAKRMGIDMLIEAFASIAKTNKKAVLVIGGAGSEKENLMALASSLSVSDKIHFKGFIPDELLSAYYRAADVFVLPTKALEGFGLVTLEAMASGTPVIGTGIGATVEILEKFDGRLLIRDISPEGIRDKLNEFLNDTGYLQNLRPMCRDYVLKNYSWDRAVEALEKVYEDS